LPTPSVEPPAGRSASRRLRRSRPVDAAGSQVLERMSHPYFERCPGERVAELGRATDLVGPEPERLQPRRDVRFRRPRRPCVASSFLSLRLHELRPERAFCFVLVVRAAAELEIRRRGFAPSRNLEHVMELEAM